MIVEEALHALDRYRLFGRELEVEFARGDRKSKFKISFKINQSYFLAPSEMRSREKEARYGRGGGGGGDAGRRDRSRRYKII